MSSLLNKKRLPVCTTVCFFVLLMAVGVMLFRDFGIPYDDPGQVELATWNHRYIFKGDPTLLSYEFRYYGVVFELPLLWIQSRFPGPSSVNVRHFVLFLTFFASVGVLYLLGRRLFHSSWWGLFTAVIFAASPRIFADAFYNSKDLPFLEMFVLATGTLMWYIASVKEKGGGPKPWIVLGLHSLASALLMDTRIPGVAVVPISVVLLAVVQYGTKKYWSRTLVSIAGYLALTAVLVILFWPILWHDPVGEFINAFRLMSRYSIYGKDVFYLGRYISSSDLPWHYLPVWIGITTPLLVLVGLLPGFVDWLRSVVESLKTALKDKWTGFAEIISNPDGLSWLAVVGWLVVPVIAVYVFHSVLYNGWRQMYFIYPPLVLISVRGFYALYTWFSRRITRPIWVPAITLAILAAGVAEPVSFMLRYPLYGYVYFNQLAGDPVTLRQRFELDYWGLSYKQGIDHILATDPSPEIRIAVQDTPGLEYISNGLTAAQKARLMVAKNQDDNARYYVVTFLFHPADYYPAKYEYYSIVVRGTKILVVYRLR